MNKGRSRDETKDLMWSAISRSQGLTGAQLAKLVKLSVSCARRHARELAEVGRVSQTIDPVTKLATYYPLGKAPKVARLTEGLELVAAHPGITGEELAERMGIDRQTCRFRMRYYVRNGLVVTDDGKSGTRSRFWMPENAPQSFADVDDKPEPPMVRRIVSASDAPPLRVRMGVRSVFELANV